MGTRISLNGKLLEVGSYSISEASTPLAGGDSSGAVGAISLSDVYAKNGNDILPTDIEGELEFLDTARGSSLGTTRVMTRNKASRLWEIEGDSRLGEFMIEVQVQPFVGDLEGAFLYYASLANISSDVIVDDALKTQVVNFPGFSGNLWQRMKELAIGVGADLNLISGVVVLRPVRKFEAIRERDIDSDWTIDGTNLALKQEVVWYDTEYKWDHLIYPPGGWNNEVRVLSVNAGETVEYRLETGASIMWVEQPIILTSVAPDFDGYSVYTVVGDDNLPIQPAQWADYGGSLTVEISDDTRELVVKMTGPVGLVQINGSDMKTFRIALTAGTSDSTYSTLRLVGEAVTLNEQSIILDTGVEPFRTGQEFAPTIDNEFLNNINSAYSAGVRGARRYAGRSFTLSSTVTELNKRGANGVATYPTYADAYAQFEAYDYAGVKTLQSGNSYADVRADLYASVETDIENQLFGNAPGARVWDRDSARWYRIREVTTSWGESNFQADDDTLWSDFNEWAGGLDYAGVNAHYSGKSYLQANLLGIPA